MTLTITIKSALATDLALSTKSQDELICAVKSLRDLASLNLNPLLSILDQTIQRPSPGKITLEKVDAYNALTKAVFQARNHEAKPLDTLLTAIASTETNSLPSSLGLLVTYAKYNTKFNSIAKNPTAMLRIELDQEIRELFERLINIKKFNIHDLIPLTSEIMLLSNFSDPSPEQQLYNIKTILKRLYPAKELTQQIEDCQLTTVKGIGDLQGILGDDFFIILKNKLEAIKASEECQNNGRKALIKAIDYFKKHINEDAYAVFNEEIKLIVGAAPSEVHLNNFFSFLNDLFDTNKQTSYNLLKNSINKYRLQTYQHEFLAQAQLYESGHLVTSESGLRLLRSGLSDRYDYSEHLGTDLAESRELLYQHLGFQTLQYDAAKTPGEPPLLLRFAEEVSNTNPLKIRGETAKFPGKGFTINGIDLYKAFGLKGRDEAGLRSFQTAFSNLVSDKAFALASRFRITTLRGMIVLSHPNINLPSSDGSKELPYSLVVYNNHFRRESPIEVALIPTSVLDKFITAASYPAEASFPGQETHIINESDLSITNLIKEAKHIGADVYDLLHYSNFASGVSHIAALNDDLSYRVSDETISSKISREVRPLYLELMRLFKIAMYHYKANTKISNTNPQTNKLGIQTPRIDLMAQELLNWHEHYNDSDIRSKEKIPILCFIDPLSWSTSSIDRYIDAIDLTYNFKTEPGGVFNKQTITGDSWSRHVLPLLYEHGSNKFIEPCFISRDTIRSLKL